MPKTLEAPHPCVLVAGRPEEEIRLRPLRRVGQLAGEIQQALRRGDMNIVGQASGLLAPALAQWAEARLPRDEHNAEVRQLMWEAQQALTACETALSRAMSEAREQQGRVRRHQKRIKETRSRKVTLSSAYGKTLNISK